MPSANSLKKKAEVNSAFGSQCALLLRVSEGPYELPARHSGV